MANIINRSDIPFYFESGVCNPGDTCEATAKEVTLVIRQRIGEVVTKPSKAQKPALKDVKPAPVPVPEPKPVSSAEFEEEHTSAVPPVHNPDWPPVHNPDWPDEFGPAKDSIAWKELAPNQKMIITRKRNQKYGPQ